MEMITVSRNFIYGIKNKYRAMAGFHMHIMDKISNLYNGIQ